jgi:hypothetical protein
MDASQHVSPVDIATIRQVAGAVLGTPAAEELRWGHRVATGGAGYVVGNRSVLRVAGEATISGRVAPWSAYLKVVHMSAADERHANDPAHNDYWRREVETYASDIPSQLPDGLAAPRCLALANAGDWLHLWIEDVQEDDPNWHVERFGLAARHFGRFNGQYLAGRPLPEYPWLNRGFLQGAC